MGDVQFYINLLLKESCLDENCLSDILKSEMSVFANDRWLNNILPFRYTKKLVLGLGYNNFCSSLLWK